MARYIDLEEFERRINKYVKPTNRDEKELVEWCRDECIRQAYCMPTADVVEVVRCGNCMHYDKKYRLCRLLHDEPIEMDGGDFCRYGERKSPERSDVE